MTLFPEETLDMFELKKRVIILLSEGWCKNFYAEDQQGRPFIALPNARSAATAVKVCIRGALLLSNCNDELKDLFCKYLKLKIGPDNTVTQFNDEADNVGQVIQLITDAIPD